MTSVAALNSLQRLRELHLQLARMAYEAAVADHVRRQREARESESALESLTAARWQAQSSETLSIDRIEWIDGARAEAAEKLARAQSSLAMAKQTLHSARETYLAARANARVAERAHSRSVAAMDHARELRTFDRLADLLVERSA